MKEQMQKRKKWALRGTAIFFVVLLLLTFFSNTIMNYSLPKVATQYVESGKIASKVRGSGVVAVAEPYYVTVNTERKIKLVMVKEGDVVEEGTLLAMFEQDEDSELAMAKENLEQAQASYQQCLITNAVSDTLASKVEAGDAVDYESYKKQITAADEAVESAQAVVDTYTATTKELQSKLDVLQNTVPDTSAEQSALTQAEAALKTAEKELEIAQNNAATLEEQYNLYMEAGQDTSGIASQLANAKGVLTAAANTQLNCQHALEQAQVALAKKQENTANAAEIASLQAQLNKETAALESASESLSAAQENYQEILGTMNLEIELHSAYNAVVDAQTALDKINAEGAGNKLTATAAGVVTDLQIAKGQTTVPGEPLMSIAKEEDGYTATITVTTEQARRVKVGDVADVDESWYYDDLSAEVSAIRKNTEDPGRSRLIDIKVTGSVDEGASLNFAIGDKNSSYDMIVPNGAVREDSSGAFILIIREKSSPLGNRYFAKRVDVEVVAKDDVNSAITGDLEGYEYVITTSTKAIQPGDQVRLTES